MHDRTRGMSRRVGRLAGGAADWMHGDMRLSISFVDRNHVAYTAWTDVTADVWQPVRVAFDEIRPNPYFQPPDARLGLAIDVSDVRFVAFAPQDRTSGRLAIGKFVVLK